MATPLNPSVGQEPRWHNLDALRAIAMLLGIGLHTAMSFTPDVPEWVQDSQQSEAFGVFVLMVHGFRMPLFFLLSGFFTALLWQRRGLQALLQQRFRRIFLPLLLSMVTIFPLVILAFVVALELDPTDNLWKAAERGDTAALMDFQAAGKDINAVNDQQTPLHAAAAAGQRRTVAWLIENGAEINALDKLGNTPLDLALENSHPQVASLLRSKGGLADLGQAPSFLKQLTMVELFAHLWFLWLLCWLVVGFAVVVLIFNGLPMIELPQALVLSPLRYLWLIPLTMIPQAYMAFPGIGADGSPGLLPVPHVLGYYAIFFGFGALYYHYRHVAGDDTRWWWLTLPLGLLIIFPLGLGQTYGREHADWNLLAVFLVAAYPWVMIFGCIGLFRRFFSQESKTLRYISDSSYWLYLAHLPLVVALQGVVLNWQMPALIKFTLICVVVTASLLWTYEKLVRYRWLGTFLNGPRERVTPLGAIPYRAT